MHPRPDVPEDRADHGLQRPTRSMQRALLPADVAAAWPRSSTAVRSVWTGVVWSRSARCDLAWAWWDVVSGAGDGSPLVAGPPGPADPGTAPRGLAAWIAAERGRCLRELGLHQAAQDLEVPALVAANDPIDAATLHISLVADAVGLVRPDQARTRLEAARRAVASLPEGPRAARQRLRLAWVGVEVALLTGSVPASDGVPRWDDVAGGPLLPDDHAHGSRFHTAKGLLFGAVVHDDARLLAAAHELAPGMLRWAVLLALADRGEPGAIHAARRAWRLVVPPPGFEPAVAASATARRLA